MPRLGSGVGFVRRFVAGGPWCLAPWVRRGRLLASAPLRGRFVRRFVAGGPWFLPPWVRRALLRPSGWLRLRPPLSLASGRPFFDPSVCRGLLCPSGPFRRRSPLRFAGGLAFGAPSLAPAGSPPPLGSVPVWASPVARWRGGIRQWFLGFGGISSASRVRFGVRLLCRLPGWGPSCFLMSGGASSAPLVCCDCNRLEGSAEKSVLSTVLSESFLVQSVRIGIDSASDST